MSESDRIAAATLADSPPVSAVIDEEDRLRPEFVSRVLDAVDREDACGQPTRGL